MSEVILIAQDEHCILHLGRLVPPNRIGLIAWRISIRSIAPSAMAFQKPSLASEPHGVFWRY